MGPDTLAESDPQSAPMFAPAPAPAPAANRPPLTPGVPPPMLRTMTRACLWVCAIGCAASVVLLLATGLGQAGGIPCAIAYSAVALAAAAATRLPDRHLGAAFTAVLSGLTLALGANAVVLGWGLSAPGWPVTGLMVCVLCAAAGWRAGCVLAVVATATVLAVRVLSPLGAESAMLPPTVLQLGTHLIAIGAGLACGVLISQVMARYLRAAHDREQRFSHLLALAADAYWETDAEHRLVAAADRAGAGTGGAERQLSAADGLGALPWTLPQFDCDAETLDGLRADLEARQPFRDLPARWARRGGRVQAFLLSGEPRFDERGVFTGYWGVARDVTAVQAAHEALAATETRYQEVFAHIPTPLVVHRDGTVIDANAAAVALFGQPSLQAMLGTDVLAHYEPGDSRERARRRLDLLLEAPLGTALPITNFRLHIQGRQVSVRATSVTVVVAGGPAVLAIYADDTERLATEETVRRSEALLSHLVATSPDLITLTEMATGRYAMVNHSFERLCGWTAAEAVGRTSVELGIWGSEDEREQFVTTLREQGTVTDLPTRFFTRRGNAVAMVVSAARFVMDRREYMVINARDVSEKERQRLEREAILANASIGIAVTREQRFMLANRHFEQIYGWGPGELSGQAAGVVWPSAEDHAEVGRLAGPLLARGDAIELEQQGLRKDGSTFMARIRGRAIDPARPVDSGTVWIVEDVTERRDFEQALARARDAAEAASRAKSAFLANTSHELRTPLNGMIGLARLARDAHTPDERRAQYLDQIVESAQALAGIISDILDLSKIEAGRLELSATTFDLGDALGTLHRTYTTLATANSLLLHYEATPDVHGAVLGDPMRLRQIVSNFLTNAIKFTAQGWVTLRASRVGPGGDTVRIEVQDSGPGFDAATRERLFKPFTQADESTTRRFGGTGLGLSICHELATLMGGQVGVDSSVGQGSTFWAELPLPRADALPPAQAVVRPGAGSLAGMRVLMVEDNPVNMMIACAMLERWGVAVVAAEDGGHAVAAVQQAAAAGQPFDVVLMDVQMPVMSGHEATRALRAGGHTVPIVALTAAALVTERDAALQAGMNDFLTKPIDADKLHATLLHWHAVPG